jgi:hypothetical protein
MMNQVISDQLWDLKVEVSMNLSGPFFHYNIEERDDAEKTEVIYRIKFDSILDPL